MGGQLCLFDIPSFYLRFKYRAYAILSTALTPSPTPPSRYAPCSMRSAFILTPETRHLKPASIPPYLQFISPSLRGRFRPVDYLAGFRLAEPTARRGRRPNSQFPYFLAVFFAAINPQSSELITCPLFTYKSIIEKIEVLGNL
jgi:hypothetical protein